MSDSIEETYRLEALSSLAGAALRPQTTVSCHCGEGLDERLAGIEAALARDRRDLSPWLYGAAGAVLGYLLGRARCARTG
jgi:hypothetical protein